MPRQLKAGDSRLGRGGLGGELRGIPIHDLDRPTGEGSVVGPKREVKKKLYHQSGKTQVAQGRRTIKVLSKAWVCQTNQEGVAKSWGVGARVRLRKRRKVG